MYVLGDLPCTTHHSYTCTFTLGANGQSLSEDQTQEDNVTVGSVREVVSGGNSSSQFMDEAKGASSAERQRLIEEL